MSIASDRRTEKERNHEAAHCLEPQLLGSMQKALPLVVLALVGIQGSFCYYYHGTAWRLGTEKTEKGRR